MLKKKAVYCGVMQSSQITKARTIYYDNERRAKIEEEFWNY